tara:strand:- start:3223 stop:4221 length:999 start_codon:yes stop_codon:yes gene_type:complete
MFVTTANTLNILPPLLDRMEVIRIPGYTEDEKVNISQKYLIPKQSKNNGLKSDEWNIDELINRKIIRHYTRESGVRNLEREISKIARKIVKKIDEKDKINNPINELDLSNYLGIEKYNYGEIEKQDRIGVVTGLAWTEVGGEILKIETVIMPGKGKMEITGQLGSVMQESIKAAKSYIRSKSLDYGIIPPIFDKKDFHVHVPEGATPKDGPSAGVGMVTSIVSAITEIPVDKNIAMTGEITLRGIVLPIGGLKEKLLAAHRAGIKKVLIPFENKKDLVEIPEVIKKNIEIIPVKNVDEVLKHALTKELKRVEWVEVEKITKNKEESSVTSTH